jgi:formylmethanofuran dehydrogenase subunit E
VALSHLQSRNSYIYYLSTGDNYPKKINRERGKSEEMKKEIQKKKVMRPQKTEEGKLQELKKVKVKIIIHSYIGQEQKNMFDYFVSIFFLLN